jgi:hypothetical protein
MTTDELIAINNERNVIVPYDPFTGKGAPLDRELLLIEDFYLPEQYVPVDMLGNAFVYDVQKAGSIKNYLLEHGDENTEENREVIANALIKARGHHDFFYWCATNGKIKPKLGGGSIPFILNRAQRRLAAELEKMRLKGVPIRIILLKARQWGGSTCIQIYMAWLQLEWKSGWYSAIVAQDSDSSRRIRMMYEKLLSEYPPELLGLPRDKKLEFGSYGGSVHDSIIKQSGRVVRDNVISVGSVVSPDSVRSGDIALAHFSECAVWKETTEWNAAKIIRSVAGAILDVPLTMIVYESTANGTGNFFHEEWLRANEEDGSPTKSNMCPVFIPWFEIENYEKPFSSEKEKQAFADWLIDNRDNDKPTTAPDAGKYYWWLWNLGATLENINWYIEKRRTFSSHGDMAAEYPSDDVEAFKFSGEKTFDIYKLNELRKTCTEPEFVGEISGDGITGEAALENVRFVEDKGGNLSVWEFPDEENNFNDRYIVIVDPQKGRTEKADYSDILVLDRLWMSFGGVPAVVAEWHGHIDKDLLAWKSAQIATAYGSALLVIERNTFDNEKGKAMDDGEFIIDVIAKAYDNMYIYVPAGKVVEKNSTSYGFFTNGSTKPAIVHNLISVVRESKYTEKCKEAVDEMSFYEKKDDGNWGAMKGKNDERVITRAIGLYISANQMRLPLERQNLKVITKTVVVKNYRP